MCLEVRIKINKEQNVASCCREESNLGVLLN